jgi:hypothetical protein
MPIRACPEEDATGTAMADCLDLHKPIKENQGGPSDSVPRRITGIFKSGKT